VIRSTLQVQVGDISDSGIRFRPSAAVRPGATYAFHADLGGFVLSVAVRVTRCHAEFGGKGTPGGQGLFYDAGAEFLWETPEDAARLSAWLAAHGSASGQIAGKIDG
jgi:hypothetical protein